MPTTNLELAERFREIADLLDLAGERFKPEAYRRAARTLEELPDDIEEIAQRGGLDGLPGVGLALAAKIEEYLRTGRIAYLERVRAATPPGLVELLRRPGLGPKTVRRLWREFGVDSPAALLEAIEAGRLRGAFGFGPTRIAQLRTAAAQESGTGRRPREEVAPVAERLARLLGSVPGVDRVEVAGSVRRQRPTVGDLDILVTSRDPNAALDAFARAPGVQEVRLRGETKETVVLDNGLQVDLRVVAPESFGAALVYFTGSKDHNIALRTRARERGLKVNEYGVYRDGTLVAGRTEEEVYAALGLPWIPPPEREGLILPDSAAAGGSPAVRAPASARRPPAPSRRSRAARR